MKTFISKNFSLFLIFWAGLAIFFPQFFQYFPKNTPIFGLGIALYASFLCIERKGLYYLKDNLFQLFSLTIIYQIILPIIFILLASPFFQNRDLFTALVITVATSSAMANPAISKSLNLRHTWTIGFVVISSLLVPFSLPIILGSFLENSVKIDVLPILYFTGGLVFIPSIAAFISRKFFPEKSQIIRNNASVIGVLSISFILGMLIAPYSEFFRENIFTPSGIYGTIAQTLLVIFLGVSGYFIFWKKSKSYRITNALLFASMNNGLAILIAYQFFHQNVVFYMILSEIPYILIPAVLGLIVKKKSR